MVASKQSTMTDRRALLTDREREIISAEADVSDSYRYQTISRVRARLERLAGDLEALEAHGDLADELRAAVCGDAGDTHTPRERRESGEERSNEQSDESPTPEPEPPSTNATATLAVEEVDLPSGIDTADATEACDAVREHLRGEGPSTKTEIVRAVMPTHPLGYDDADALDKIKDGARYRGAWWRKIIQPALDADPEVDHRENHHDYNL